MSEEKKKEARFWIPLIGLGVLIFMITGCGSAAPKAPALVEINGCQAYRSAIHWIGNATYMKLTTGESIELAHVDSAYNLASLIEKDGEIFRRNYRRAKEELDYAHRRQLRTMLTKNTEVLIQNIETDEAFAQAIADSGEDSCFNRPVRRSFVFVPGKQLGREEPYVNLNVYLVEQGICVYFPMVVFDNPYAKELKKAHKYARKNDKGMWLLFNNRLGGDE